MEESKRKFTIKDNDVPSVAQLTAGNGILFFGNAKAKRRILIVGNSITLHGPKPEIGWEWAHGMAASAPEKDYVHLLCERILEAEDAYIMVNQLAAWERRCTEEEALSLCASARAFAPDLLIFRLGENIPSPTDAGGQERLENAFSRFVSYICPEGAQVLFTTCFWEHGVVDAAIRAVAKCMHMPLVTLGDLGDEDKYMAVGLFDHNGVAHHPGDLGMAAIADRIYKAMEN